MSRRDGEPIHKNEMIAAGSLLINALLKFCASLFAKNIPSDFIKPGLIDGDLFYMLILVYGFVFFSKQVEKTSGNDNGDAEGDRTPRVGERAAADNHEGGFQQFDDEELGNKLLPRSSVMLFCLILQCACSVLAACIFNSAEKDKILFFSSGFSLLIFLGYSMQAYYCSDERYEKLEKSFDNCNLSCCSRSSPPGS